MTIPKLIIGKTRIGQISRKEVAEIKNKLETTPKRSIKHLNDTK